MTTIHLLGSEGFIGRALQSQAEGLSLHCWSHRSKDPEHYFDLLDQSSWKFLLREKPSHIILLSWPGLPRYHEKFHVTRNLPACIELIDKLVESGLQRVVFAGTCYEYGLQNGPLREEQLTEPANCYAIAKDSLRRVIASRYSTQHLQWCWARIFYPYGHGQNPTSLLPSLFKAMQVGEEFFPMGSGRQLRDFVDVQDVARQLLTLSIHDHARGIYNVGSGIPRSVLEMVEETIVSYGSTIKLKRGDIPDRTDEPLAFWADVGRFQRLRNIPHSQK